VTRTGSDLVVEDHSTRRGGGRGECDGGAPSAGLIALPGRDPPAWPASASGTAAGSGCPASPAVWIAGGSSL